MNSISRVVSIFVVLFSAAASADNIYTAKWDRGGDKRGVVAFDLSKATMVWEIYPCRIPNFAERTSVGVLVGCDDSNVLLLNPANGAVIWRRDLAVIEPDERRRERRPYRERKVNRFHKESAEGFLVSQSDEEYMILGKKGEYLMYCGKEGCTTMPKVDREGNAK